MYSTLPPRERRAVKISLTVAWLFSGLAGVSALVVSPVTIVSELGMWGTLISAAILAVTSIMAALGIALGRYRWEWVGAWFSAAALSPYLATVWYLCFTDSLTRSTQAFLITSLATFFVTRAVLCSAHAAKLRIAHVSATLAIDSVTADEGDDDGRSSPPGG